MPYAMFERTVKRIILTGIFHFWSGLKRMRPMNWSFSAILICIKNKNLKNNKIRTISIFCLTGQILCGME